MGSNAQQCRGLGHDPEKWKPAFRRDHTQMQSDRSTHDSAQTSQPLGMLWGPLTPLGLVVAALSAAIDQASKLWLIYGYELGAQTRVQPPPFLELVLTWNPGISYGLFKSSTPLERWALLAAMVAAAVLLWLWLARASSRLTAVALGLILGGAAGNAIDRILHGAVADFIAFHIRTGWIDFDWYVFNLADAAIVAGVIGLLYGSVLGNRAAKAP